MVLLMAATGNLFKPGRAGAPALGERVVSEGRESNCLFQIEKEKLVASHLFSCPLQKIGDLSISALIRPGLSKQVSNDNLVSHLELNRDLGAGAARVRFIKVPNSWDCQGEVVSSRKLFRRSHLLICGP